MLWQTYLTPTTVAQALHALQTAPAPARFIAGGTDLLLDLEQNRQPPVHTLIDVTRIPELCRIEATPDGIYIGAAVSISQIVAHPLIQQHAPALAQACNQIGGPQVRQVATLGGNVAHALPAADGAIALFALDCQAEIADSAGMRRVPLIDLYRGPGVSALTEWGALLVGFLLPPAAPNETSRFARIMRPQGVALPILNMAIWQRTRLDGCLDDLRIALGPAARVPFRARATENVLRGQPLNTHTLQAAVETLRTEAQFRTSSQRATAEYRRHLAGVLLQRLLLPQPYAIRS